MKRVANGELLDVHEVRDEEQVDAKERQQDPVHLPAAQRDRRAPWRNDGNGTRGTAGTRGIAGRGRAIWRRVH